VARIDPRTNQVTKYPFAGPRGATDIAFGSGLVWTTLPALNAVVRIDPRTDKPLEKPLLIWADPLFVAVGDGEVWISNSEGAVISRVKR